MAPTQQEEEAERLRQEGNAYFKQGKLVEAEKRYSQSIEAHPSSASFANRAAVYSKQGRWDQVESDCTAALQLDPASVKAYFRRWVVAGAESGGAKHRMYEDLALWVLFRRMITSQTCFLKNGCLV